MDAAVSCAIRRLNEVPSILQADDSLLPTWTGSTGHSGMLENGRRSGDLGDTADLDQLAAILTTLLIEVVGSIRAEAPPEQLHATSRAVSNILDMHQPADRR